MIGSHHRGGAVVVFRLLVDDQPAVLKVFGHRCARIRRGVLNVGPIDVSAREFKVGLNRLACIPGIADDQTANHIHFVPVQSVDGFEWWRCQPFGHFHAARSWNRPAENSGRFQDVLDAEENIAETRLAHQRRERLAVVRDRRSHRLNDVIHVVQAAPL